MRIVDLSCDVAGRFASKLFAMAGVEVIRLAGTGPGSDLTTYLDTHKRIVPGADAGALIADADVVFTSFDQGRWQGLAAEPLALPPSCTQVTTSNFGTTGPYARWRGGPMAEWAAGGYFAITGDPEREPLIGPETLCGYVAGYTAAIAAEAALRVSRSTGYGCQVDVSTMESMLCVHQSTFARVAAGLGRQRTGRYTEVYPLVVRPCADGYVSLGVVTDAEFDRLAIAIGRPDLGADPRFANPAARWANCDALDEGLHRFLGSRSAEEVVAILQVSDVAAAKVADCLELIANPQLRYRGFWDEDHAGAMPGNPIPKARRFGTAERAARQPGGPLPLSGVTVLDFTAFWAGPSATRTLADLGADVIKVERPGSRIDLEDRLPDPQAMVQHLYHCKMNRRKKSVAVDLGTAEGQAAIQRLTRTADVLVENFRPGVAERLGIGPEQLCAANPALVYVSLSGFGHGGPWGDRRSYGPTIEAASSIEARTGYADGEPLRLGHTLPDGVGGLLGALAALRGLRERGETGRGGWFDLSQLEAYAAMSGEEILTASKLGRPLPRIGNRSRGEAIQGAFPCLGEDQWITLRLADAGEVGRFAALADVRVPDQVADYTRKFEKFDLAERLQGEGFEAFPVLTPQDLIDDPHLRERGFFIHVEAAGRIIPLPGSPLRGEPRLANADGPAPRFGEHTQEILGETVS